MSELEQGGLEGQFATAKRLVLRRLAVRSYATDELRKFLRDKGIAEEALQYAIDEATRLGYCDDRRWVDHFICSHRAKKCARWAILMKLKSKGVSEELLQYATEQLEDVQEQQEVLQRLLATRYKKYDLSKFDERQKVIASLMRRGFTLGEIQGLKLGDVFRD